MLPPARGGGEGVKSVCCPLPGGRGRGEKCVLPRARGGGGGGKVWGGPGQGGGGGGGKGGGGGVYTVFPLARTMKYGFFKGS